MNHSLNDPQSQALEARLAAMPPAVSTARQQQLLYECAFTAGRKSAGRRVRRWQAVAVALMVALVGLSVPRISDVPPATERGAAVLSQEESLREPADVAAELSPYGRRPHRELSLDAWQVRKPKLFGRELAAFADSDPRLRSLTVAALTREMFEEHAAGSRE